jgi:PAS domain S-box-containing protein
MRKNRMGEKVGPAATPAELPIVDALSDAVGRARPPLLARIADPNSASSPTNGHSAPPPLITEKAYYEQIIQNAPEAISIIDHELGIARINTEFTRLFGFTEAEALGKRLDQLIVPPDRYAETAWISESLKAQAKLTLETRRQRKDGTLVEVMLSASPVTVDGKRKSEPTPRTATSPSRSAPRT